MALISFFKFFFVVKKEYDVYNKKRCLEEGVALPSFCLRRVLEALCACGQVAY